MSGHLFWLTVAVVILGTWRATRLVIRDDFPPVAHLRDRILARHPAATNRYWASEVADPTAEISTVRLAGKRERILVVAVSEGAPYGYDDDGNVILFGDDHPVWSPAESTTIGTLITCGYCAGFWISVLAVTGVWLLTPAGTLPLVVWLAAPWALSAAVVYIDNVIDG